MIRPACPADVPAIHRLIRDLAAEERSLDQVAASEEDLRRSLFAPDPAVFAHVAVCDGRIVGFALWFLTYSTWTGRHGIYLEDLYVTPERRGRGHGRALMATLARICVERGYERLEWSVLNWNTPAIGFYTSLGARPLREWTMYRLSGAALRELGSAGGFGSRSSGPGVGIVEDR